MRGFLARKQAQLIKHHTYKANTGFNQPNDQMMIIDDDGAYNNPLVQEIRQKLGEFRYKPAINDGIQREAREELTLENMAKY